MRVAVVGATGAVGREMLQVLAQREFPYSSVLALASARSAGDRIEFADDELLVEELTPESFKEVDIALFSAGGEVSKKFALLAAESGAVVIDNSSAFRMEPNVPLIVPEVNADALRRVLRSTGGKHGLIVANPNCSTIQLAVVLHPLQRRAGLKRVIISTYQSVSGAGQKGIEELWQQTVAICNQKEVAVETFSRQIAFNCIPHCDVFLDNGYTKEEMKLVNESRKILDLPTLAVSATAVRVPVFASHSESVNVELENPLTLAEARELLATSPGIVLTDEYPVAIEVAGTDATYVGRLRRDESVANGFNLWIVADNLRKGAALNAVQIAEIVLKERQLQ